MTGLQEELLSRAKAGDREAAEELVIGNSGLIWSIARRFFGRGVDPDDLYQLGCLGFLKAVEGFDLSYGTQFSTYAVPKISGEIRRFLRDDGTVKVSRSVRELAARAAAAQERLRRQTGREPGVQDVARELGVDAEEVALALDAGRPCLSLSESRFDDEDGAARVEYLSDPDGELRMLDRLLLKDLLLRLDARERQIIVMRYFKDRTQAQVARVLGVSQVQVSRLEARILKKLREMAT